MHISSDKIKLLDGETIRIGQAAGACLNPLDCVACGNINHIMATQSNRIISLFEALAGVPLTASKRVLLEQCAEKVYQPFINSYNPDTGLYDHSLAPTPRDLYQELREQDNDDARQLADMLKHLLPESLEDIHEDHL